MDDTYAGSCPILIMKQGSQIKIYIFFAALMELRVNVVLVWEVNEPGEGRAAPQIC
jgi:hypothetical protein